MPATFVRAIRVPTKDEHPYQARTEDQRSHPAYPHDAPAGQALEHGRLPKPKSIAAAIGKKEANRKHQNRRMPERLPKCHVLRVRFGLPFFREPGSDPIALLSSQPSRLVRPIGEEEE